MSVMGYSNTLTAQMEQAQLGRREDMTLKDAARSGMIFCPQRLSSIAILRCAEYQKQFGCRCPNAATKKQIAEVAMQLQIAIRGEEEASELQKSRWKKRANGKPIDRPSYPRCLDCGSTAKTPQAPRCRRCAGHHAASRRRGGCRVRWRRCQRCRRIKPATSRRHCVPCNRVIARARLEQEQDRARRGV